MTQADTARRPIAKALRALAPAALLPLLLAAGFGSPAQAQGTGGFLRGDANGDAQVDLGDAVTSLLLLFQGKEVPCLASADVDANDRLEITDPIALLTYLFLAGPAPTPPFPACGPSADPGLLGCIVPQCLGGSATTWMARGDGCRQCEPCLDIEETVKEVEAMGIPVLDSKRIGIWAVIAMCGAGTGRVDAVEVATEDADLLLQAGWIPLDTIPQR